MNEASGSGTGGGAPRELGSAVTAEPAGASRMPDVIPVDALAERPEPPGPEPSTALRTATGARVPAWMASAEQFEAFRELRTRLLDLSVDAPRKHFTTMIVPMTERCGGSFVARNLAAAFTLQQRPSLVIECNLRAATEDDDFGPGRDAVGLFDFLLEVDSPSAVLPIWPTVVRGLNVIPAGRRDPALAVFQREQLSSPAMRELMSKVRTWPCHAFLDAPPVAGSPDARILADVADYVVLVVGYGCATPRAIEQAAANFERSKFAGAVFNEASTPAATTRRR